MTTVTAAVAREHHAPLTPGTARARRDPRRRGAGQDVATGSATPSRRPRRRRPTPLPAVLGHEGTGVVEQVGKAITTVSPGDHVVLAAAYCGTCRQCRAGRMAYCENLFAQDFGGRRTDGSTALSGGRRHARLVALLRAVVVLDLRQRRRDSIVRVDPRCRRRFSRRWAAGSTPVPGAVLNELRPPAGSSFAVTGAGAVGLAAVMAARVAGCTTIVAVDLHDSRLELAREIGPPTRSTPGRPTWPANCRPSPAARASTTSSTPPACPLWSAARPVRSRSAEPWRSWEQRPPGRQPPSTSTSPPW